MGAIKLCLLFMLYLLYPLVAKTLTSVHTSVIYLFYFLYQRVPDHV